MGETERRAALARRAHRAADLLATRPEFGHTTQFVVTHEGEPLLTRSWGASAAAGLADTYSMTKSVVATLTGIAVDRDLVALDDPVASYLPGAPRDCTVRHLLTMTAGAESGGAWDIDAVMERERGWVDWILTAPRLHAPGTRFGYDNGSIHVLGAALAAAVGVELEAFAADALFAPLEIESFAWPRDPDGRNYGFGHLRLSPMDLAKLGELYLGHGVYHGRRVVSRSFVASAVRMQSAGGPPEDAGYGFLWWCAPRPLPHFFAAGYAGQSLTVLPDLGVVAVTIGDEARLQEAWRNGRHAVLEAFTGGHC